jgi:predicted RNA-binding Zn-ribbon protein involved in translation (DUF1610 family)
MRECPKCSAKYGDDINFCLACGAMLDTVVEAPPQPPAAALPSRKEAEKPKPAPTPNISKVSAADKAASAPVTHEVKRPAASKQPSLQCPRCGSTKIVPDARIRDYGEPSDGMLHAMVDADPKALIFKDRLYFQLLADICGECGHVELRAEDHRKLYSHYLQSRDKQWT